MSMARRHFLVGFGVSTFGLFLRAGKAAAGGRRAWRQRCRPARAVPVGCVYSPNCTFTLTSSDVPGRTFSKDSMDLVHLNGAFPGTNTYGVKISDDKQLATWTVTGLSPVAALGSTTPTSLMVNVQIKPQQFGFSTPSSLTITVTASDIKTGVLCTPVMPLVQSMFYA